MTLPLAQVCKNTSASVLAARWFCFSPWHGQAMWPTIFIYITVQIWRTFHFSLPLLKHCPIVSLRIKTPPLFFLRPFLAKYFQPPIKLQNLHLWSSLNVGYHGPSLCLKNESSFFTASISIWSLLEKKWRTFLLSPKKCQINTLQSL